MIGPDLPAELKAALETKLHGLSRSDAAGRSARISETYRSGGGSAAIRTEADALAYALARMPATYAAVTSSLNALCEVRPDFAPKNLLDVGAGPGTATWAAAETFSSLADFTSIDANTSLRTLALDLFAETRARFGIPSRPARELVAGIRMDLTTTRYETWADLRTYCYRVAGTVGEMVAPIFGCRDVAALSHAAELGIAMQLTNILRDVGEDAHLGRLYLPLDEIAAFGCEPEALLAGKPDARFPELMAFQVARARALYRSAHQGIRALAPSGRFTTLAASILYAGILTEIERLDYAVFNARAHVSSPRKVRALPGITAAFVRLSLPSASRPAPRSDGAESLPYTDLAGAAPAHRIEPSGND